jgi:plasmid stability protein
LAAGTGFSSRLCRRDELLRKNWFYVQARRQPIEATNSLALGLANYVSRQNLWSKHDVRNLDDELIARLKRRAARHGRSAEAEHREILRPALANEAEPSFDQRAADLRKLTRRRKQTPSEIPLREGRNER